MAWLDRPKHRRCRTSIFPWFPVQVQPSGSAAQEFQWQSFTLASHRDLCRLDHGTPFGAFAVDECLEIVRRAANALQRVLLEDGLALVAPEKGIHGAVHLAHDVRRRTGWSYDRIPSGRFKSLEAGFLYSGHIGQLRDAL